LVGEALRFRARLGEVVGVLLSFDDDFMEPWRPVSWAVRIGDHDYVEMIDAVLHGAVVLEDESAGGPSRVLTRSMATYPPEPFTVQPLSISPLLVASRRRGIVCLGKSGR